MVTNIDYNLSKRFTLSWDNKTRFVELLRMEKIKKGVAETGKIEERIKVEYFAEVRKYLHTFGHLTKDEFEQTSSSFSHAV